MPALLKRDLSRFPPRHVNTVNKLLTLLGTISAAAKRASNLDDASTWPNHFGAVKLEADDREDNREPFNAADLRRVFTGPVHRDGKRYGGGSGESQFWFPIAALLTGARLDELAQLRLCDVDRDEDSGRAYLDISTSGGRTVKSRSSRRKVPVHPELERIGFLRYVASMRENAKSGDAPLWPLISATAGRPRSAAWSQWFGRYLRRTIGIEDRRKVFHSFRHSFKDMCRDAGLGEEIHDALTGHSSTGNVSRGYGSGPSLRRLAMEIDKIAAPAALASLTWSAR